MATEPGILELPRFPSSQLRGAQHKAGQLLQRVARRTGQRVLEGAAGDGQDMEEREEEAVAGETPSPHPNPTLHHPVPKSPCSTGRGVMEGAPREGEDTGEREGQSVVGEEKPGREGKATAAAQDQGKGRERAGEQWWVGARSYIWNFVSFT
uniref:Uncharacterized protein n=1 Tax=Oryza meridionalis TaxID=40149 RepID=A0A0E0DI87_9ORYZ